MLRSVVESLLSRREIESPSSLVAEHDFYTPLQAKVIRSTSTRTSRGSRVTSTVERAGGFARK
jgi:hypothetical protein